MVGGSVRTPYKIRRQEGSVSAAFLGVGVGFGILRSGVWTQELGVRERRDEERDEDEGMLSIVPDNRGTLA